MTVFFRCCSALTLLFLMLAPGILAQQAPNDFEREDPGRRQEYFYHVRSYPFGRIPQGARLEAVRHATEQMKSFRSSRGLQSINEWRLIGPSREGGRVNALAIHPTNSQIIWAGAASGGVWKTTDRGASWVPVMDFENAIWTGALAVDPSNPDIVYVGTGDPTPSNGDSYPGAGVFKSTDGGITWKPIGLTSVGAVTGIIIDPRNTSNLLVGCHKNNAGIYRSTDGGASWTRTSPQPVSNIEVNAQNPDQMWFSTWKDGIVRTDDGGRTFTTKNSGLASDGTTLQRTSVAASPSSPNVLYAIGHESVGTGPGAQQLSRIYKSTNSGDSWQLVFDSRVNGNNFLGNAAQSQGWYNNVIAVKSDDPNVAVAGGVSMVRTANGGQSWSVVGQNVHVDHHSMAFDVNDPGTYFNGNDGGIYRSSDGGASYSKTSNGLAITQFYDLAIDQRADNVTYGGTQDNGTYVVTPSGAERIAGGDGFYVVVDHSNSNTIYGEFPDGAIWKLDRSTGQMRSMTNGLADGAEWSAPLIQHPADPNTLFSGRARVYATVDGAESWTAVSPYVNGFMTALAISTVNPDVVYAGSRRGSIIVSRDGGGEWTDHTLTSGLPSRHITDFAPSLTNESVCYVALGGFYGGHIYKTTDYGATWSDISAELPDITVNALAIHPDDEQTLYAGTDIGMFITTDGGLTWATYDNGLPRTEVLDMEVHLAKRVLRIATFGRSLWEIDLESPAVPPSITSPHGGEVWIARTPRLISWQGFDGPVKVEYSIDDGSNWMELATNVAGTAFRWNVPDRPTIFGRVRVTSMDGTKAATSFSFTIERIQLGGILTQHSKPIIPYGICYDGEFLWSLDFSSRTMLKLDPATLETRAVIQTQLTGGDSLFTDLAYHPAKGTIFVHRLSSTAGSSLGWLYEMRKDGTQVNRWQSPARYPIGLAWMGEHNEDMPYFLATDRDTDRDGKQNIYLIDPDQGTPIVTIPRPSVVPSGPRGATSAGGNGEYYQVVTDFTGGSLVGVTADKVNVETQDVSCSFTIQDNTGLVNARGIERDPADKNVWVTDYNGNIYKMVTCEGLDSSAAAVRSETGITGVLLMQNTPNPFRSETEISFTLPRSAKIRLVVHDANGRHIATLADGGYSTGTSHVRFDAAGLPSGLYRYTLMVDGRESLTKGMVVVR